MDQNAKKPSLDHPVHDLVAQRWSPVGFADRTVEVPVLRSLFEAARWAASSFNEQPWRYLVATREDPTAFEKMVSCLVDANQAWAKHAPVLAMGVTKLTFTRNDKPNRVALHDLGAASAQLTLEATARGLFVHQMAGIHRDRIREIYSVPEGFDPETALAIGYPGEAPGELAERDRKPRSRRSQDEFVFAGEFGRAFAR